MVPFHATALQMVGITKIFGGGVVANDHIDFSLEMGEIHALLGENGAGKSTLMNILYGLYQPDAGHIYLNPESTVIGAARAARKAPSTAAHQEDAPQLVEVKFNSPNDAIGHGIGMVHQHFMLIPTLTVAENIMLGYESTNGPLLDQKVAAARIRMLSQQFGLDVNPAAYVRDLPVGNQQRVEIIKALYRNADILILDEPTAVLTPQEAEELFGIMRELAAEGKSIIFITHKLKEVLAVAQRITVLRQGKVVATRTRTGPTTAAAGPDGTDEASLAQMMVGREVLLKVQKGPAHPGAPVLVVENLRVADDSNLVAGSLRVEDVSLEVRAGEILGIAGVEGNGQSQLVEALVGLRKPLAGRIWIDGQETTNFSPRQITELGVAHIPEDRQREGLVTAFPVADNLVLNTYYRPPFAHGPFIDEKAIRNRARKLVQAFDVRPPNIFAQAGTLSGGNQQKVVVAREFSRPLKLLVAAQPTRGLDVGSIEFIHKQIVQKRDGLPEGESCAILLVSAELDEILSLSDRIAVMYRGRILALLDQKTATQERLGLLMAGITTSEVTTSAGKE